MNLRQRALRHILSLDRPVGRSAYAVIGVLLLLTKYAVEAAALRAAGGPWLPLASFLDPVVLHHIRAFSATSPLLADVVAVWSLPFIWIGLSMSVRRAIDAGASGWMGLFFLLPYANCLAILSLCLMPSAPEWPAYDLARQQRTARADLLHSMRALLAALMLAGIALGLTVHLLGQYGSVLFVATPVMIGFVHALVLGGGQRVSLRDALAQGQLALLACLLVLLMLALEGAICLTMAWPLLAPLTLAGSALGWATAGRRSPGPPGAGILPGLVVLLLPLLAWQEGACPAPLREISSSVEVDAPPAVVWRHVVSFPDLPPPDGIFASGIACPLRARIEGSGVGAIRFCEFTTGPFVEPITTWDEPHRLAFNVTAQPPTMRELSPWGDIHPPHLDGYLRSRRGEFRLVPLDGGRRTRLEGSTWYELQVSPGPYWHLWGDGLIHAIHARVLEHIRKLAEGDARG